MDWEYPRTFGQDYNMDGEITQMQDHEKVQIWDFFDPTIPAAWDDRNQDGQWDHVEEITVMDSDFAQTEILEETEFPQTELLEELRDSVGEDEGAIDTFFDDDDPPSSMFRRR